MTTELSRLGGAWMLNGVKYYSTGSNFADWISVAARRDGDEVGVIVMVDAGAPGVAVEDDWSGFGQRTTGSGTSRFAAVAVEDSDIFAFSERAPYQEAVYQLVHVTTLAGIARAAHRDAVAHLRQRARAYGHGLSDIPRDDAQLQSVVGRLRGPRRGGGHGGRARGGGCGVRSPAHHHGPGAGHGCLAVRRAWFVGPRHLAGARPALAQCQDDHLAQPARLQGAAGWRVASQRHATGRVRRREASGERCGEPWRAIRGNLLAGHAHPTGDFAERRDATYGSSSLCTDSAWHHWSRQSHLLPAGVLPASLRAWRSGTPDRHARDHENELGRAAE
jgi:hypothetical protein